VIVDKGYCFSRSCEHGACSRVKISYSIDIDLKA